METTFSFSQPENKKAEVQLPPNGEVWLPPNGDALSTTFRMAAAVKRYINKNFFRHYQLS
ncbi:MAG: hypothetical protein JJE25_06555 [Bacteroidia bacterium]|nr:hypothetical protein [Bacteroidia bacterium]